MYYMIKEKQFKHNFGLNKSDMHINVKQDEMKYFNNDFDINHIENVNFEFNHMSKKN